MDDTQAAAMTFILTAMAIGFFFALIVSIFYFMTLRRALARCAAESRRMSPNDVWLGIIPIFSLVWPFFYVPAIASSLEAEFVRRRMPPVKHPGRTLGLAFAVLQVLSCIPGVNLLTAVPMIVCWIAYWIKIADYSRRIATPYVDLSETAAPEPTPRSL